MMTVHRGMVPARNVGCSQSFTLLVFTALHQVAQFFFGIQRSQIKVFKLSSKSQPCKICMPFIAKIPNVPPKLPRAGTLLTLQSVKEKRTR